MIITVKASSGLFWDPTRRLSCTTSVPLLIWETLLLWGFNILCLFKKSSWRIISLPPMTRQIAWHSLYKADRSSMFRIFWLLCNRVSYPSQNGLNDYLRFKKTSIRAVVGGGGGRGPKNISMVDIWPLPHCGHISGSYLRCSLQTSFQCFFSLTIGVLIPKASWSSRSSCRHAVESNP